MKVRNILRKPRICVGYIDVGDNIEMLVADNLPVYDTN